MKEDKIDMMQTALDHYEEAAAAINHWMSDIPEAIKQYYTTPEAKDGLLEKHIAQLLFNIEEFHHDSIVLRSNSALYLEKYINHPK